jgi:hypothetical protein
LEESAPIPGYEVLRRSTIMPATHRCDKCEGTGRKCGKGSMNQLGGLCLLCWGTGWEIPRRGRDE